VIGGLGSAVASHLSTTNPTRIKMLGVNDRFGESGGSEELLELMSLDISDIEAACRELL
jgi:transketolase